MTLLKTIGGKTGRIEIHFCISPPLNSSLKGNMTYEKKNYTPFGAVKSLQKVVLSRGIFKRDYFSRQAHPIIKSRDDGLYNLEHRK